MATEGAWKVSGQPQDLFQIKHLLTHCSSPAWSKVEEENTLRALRDMSVTAHLKHAK